MYSFFEVTRGNPLVASIRLFFFRGGKISPPLCFQFKSIAVPGSHVTTFGCFAGMSDHADSGDCGKRFKIFEWGCEQKFIIFIGR